MSRAARREAGRSTPDQQRVSHAVGGIEIPSSTEKLDQPRLLIIEHDRAGAARMVVALGRDCCRAGLLAASADGAGRLAANCDCAKADADSACCVLIGSLQQLHEFDLTHPDVVICSTNLPDGSGLDALAYIRGVRPDLPVILVGEPGEAAVAVEAIRAGALDFLATTDHGLRTLPLAVEKCLAHQRVTQENERLQRDLSRSLAELAVKNQQFQAVIRQLEAMARTDDLTRLCNRRWLNEMLERAWAEAVRNDRPLAFVMIDLDRFKTMNDRMGHQRGDEALRQTGEIIQANCRQVDVPARYGGDEFCVLMPETEPREAIHVAQRILREYEFATRAAPKGEPRIGMSIGVAHINLSRPVNVEQLIRHADEAMYAAKSHGNQRIMVRGMDGVFAPLAGDSGQTPIYTGRQS